ncbi:type 2 periplasmic-binding domain-containing protein [Parachitinimonas caeni]|uniref:Transporter substrate-binding domain-containing protein n=1 Tax=Parachitinimonas caeni TaxID=3031301 RepID=A0ABT7DVL8_9NEIS|nr:transporter substrate-binding domain-containing protein [Parachitinimonas caeni]MDK2123879.1 transporter substrate-binding domain-containing protein [Parachitinimonas caeni]
MARLEDARNARIGSYHANAGTKMLQQKGYQVVVSVNHEASLRNLMAGRLDYWLAGRYTALALIANANALDKVVPALVVDQFPMYLACNPQTNELTLKKLEAAFQQLSQDGTFVAIDKHYDNWLPSRGR